MSPCHTGIHDTHIQNFDHSLHLSLIKRHSTVQRKKYIIFWGFLNALFNICTFSCRISTSSLTIPPRKKTAPEFRSRFLMPLLLSAVAAVVAADVTRAVRVVVMIAARLGIIAE